MSPILQIQRRMMELGRVRLGEKGPKGEPRKRDTFRFTTASQPLAAAVANQYGGKVQEWKDAPDDGYWQVSTDATELEIILPPVYDTVDGSPTTSYSQWYELWSGGGCQRRCDGMTEAISGKPCMCNPEERECKVTTRVSFMIPSLPSLGVWRLDTKGWNAAVELPGTLEVLVRAAAENTFIPATLRIEQRTKKVPGEGTRRYVVPVIDLPSVTIGQLVSGDVPSVLNAPRPAPERPALPSGPAPPADASFPAESAAHGPPTPLPSEVAPYPYSDDENVVKLRAELHRLAFEDGADPSETERSIFANANDKTLKQHVDWLNRCIKRVTENIASKKGSEQFPIPEGARSS